ncbi:MAG TPA: Mrp/NBP35 family ATP-binding protein [Candidatus Acidoferrales bacterium]|nr:Mrp/NBP35 family ATP-binding protein [Candidatus Acidoferrales bacterium]
MVSKDQIMASLKDVIDPELHISIVNLQMVKNVEIQGDRVKVLIALTVGGCPLSKTISNDVEKAVTKLPGVKTVNVETTVMTKQELEQLRTKIQGQMAATQAQKPGSTMPPGINRLERKGIRNVLAIMSGKGGVGKSFVTAFLAVQLTRLGYKVGILDADITGPSIAKMFGLKGPLFVTADKHVLPAVTRTGIKVVSMNLILEEPQMPVIVRGPIINSVIRQMFQDIEWGDLHFLLTDLPPGTSDAPLTVFQSLPLQGVIVVTTPQDLALMVVAKAINMAKTLSEQLNAVKILGLIENMSYVICPHCGERLEIFGRSKAIEAAKKAGIPYLGAVPIDPDIARLADEGKIEDYSNPLFEEVTRAVRVNATSLLEPIPGAMPIAWTEQKSG